MAIKYLSWIIYAGAFLHVSSCSNDENESGKTNRLVEVFEEQERNKLWYESNFSTPYKDISSLKGHCLAWGMSGQCLYTFITNSAVVFRENQPMETPSCTEIIGWLARDLENKEQFQNIEKLECGLFKNSEGNEITWVVNRENRNYFVREVYKLNGK